MFDICRKEIEWGGRKLVLESGRLARQADGAVLATYGDTSVLCTAVAARSMKPGVDFYIQFGSESVEEYARARGYVDVFEKTGVRVIHPGCGACIGCGPGVSGAREQVTVSAINRNYQNRSGPGKLYLASPLTVAASAVAGRIVAYREGMFTGGAAPS